MFHTSPTPQSYQKQAKKNKHIFEQKMINKRDSFPTYLSYFFSDRYRKQAKKIICLTVTRDRKTHNLVRPIYVYIL